MSTKTNGDSNIVVFPFNTRTTTSNRPNAWWDFPEVLNTD